jgi:hypothetical protein
MHKLTFDLHKEYLIVSRLIINKNDKIYYFFKKDNVNRTIYIYI